MFYENRIGGLTSIIAGGLADTAAAYSVAARDGVLTHSTLREVRTYLPSAPMPI